MVICEDDCRYDHPTVPTDRTCFIAKPRKSENTQTTTRTTEPVVLPGRTCFLAKLRPKTIRADDYSYGRAGRTK